MSKKYKDGAFPEDEFVPGAFFGLGGAPFPGVAGVSPLSADIMTYPTGDDLRLDPEKRVCPEYDRHSVKEYDLPSRDMGFRVIDNCPEENQK